MTEARKRGRPIKPVTEEQFRAVLDDYERTHSVKKSAAAAGITDSMFYAECRRRGVVPPKHRRQWTPEMIDRIRELAGTGAKCKDIAGDVGMSAATVYNIGHEHGIRFRRKKS